MKPFKSFPPPVKLASSLARRTPLVAALVWGLAAWSASPAFAQSPPTLEPLPEISTPPQIGLDPKLEPEVKIFNRGADKVEEFRVNGKLYMVRITPPGGAPYVLLDQTGGGHLIPSNGQVDARSISVPMWVIKTF